jgi:hypothetical protein
MPSVSVRLSRAQIDDLIAMCQVGAAGLNRVAKALGDAQPTIKRSQLKQLISGSTSDANAADASARALPGLATAIRKFGISPPELLEGVQSGLGSNVGDETLRLWHECRPIIERMLTTRVISLYAKARDLAFDFERLYARARILTDVRPVYDDERNIIVGADVTQTLRMDYFSAEDTVTKSITIALDIPDIEQLKKCCEDAIRKAEVARSLIESSGMEVVLPGEQLQ